MLIGRRSVVAERRRRPACRGSTCCRRPSTCPAPKIETGRRSSDRAHRLDKALDAAPPGRWDICLIDCPPSLGLLTVNALVAARHLLVPLQCEFFALEGLSQLLQTVERIRLAFNPELSILGVALTMFDRRNNLSQQVAEDVRACLGDAVFETVVPRNVRLSEAPSHGLPALIYDLRCPGSEAYIRLARELMARLPAAGGGGMSAERPAKGLGRAFRADGRSGAPERRAAGRSRAAACARSKSPGSGPIRAQPRQHFDEEALDELAESIAERGVLQPILLRPDGDGFEIIAGERRWRAAQRARLHAIPAIVRDIDDAATAEIALIENIQREDLNAIEEAEGYRQLIDRYGHTQETSASWSTSRAATSPTCCDCSNFRIRAAMLMRGDISMGHARAVATAPDPEALAAEIIAKGLSVRQAEARARKRAKKPARASSA